MKSHPRGGGDRRGVDVAEDQCQHIVRDDGQKDRPSADDAAEESERRHQKHQRDEADEWSLLEIRLGSRCQLKPISAMIAPVTTGGSVTSIQRVPTTCKTTPMMISVTPPATKPPSALPVPCEATAAVTGAITEKLDPR